MLLIIGGICAIITARSVETQCGSLRQLSVSVFQEVHDVALRILGDRVMIKVDEAPKTEGGIILPETAQAKPQQGTVIAVGEGRRTSDGVLLAPDVKEGDVVLFAKYGGTEVVDEGEDYKILENSLIYAKMV